MQVEGVEEIEGDVNETKDKEDVGKDVVGNFRVKEEVEGKAFLG